MPTFLELATEWLETEARRLVEPANERRHIAHMRALWPLREPELRPSVINRTLASLLRPLGHLGAVTVNKVRSTGKRIIRAAMLDDRWSGQNPFEVVPRLRQPTPHHRCLSLEECRKLLPKLREDRRREALTMLYLGLRPGELKALRKEDVDLRAKTIVVRRSNARDSTKTGKKRELPIPAALLPVLKRAIATNKDSPLVFPGKDGKRQRADSKLTRALKDAMRRARLVIGYERICRRAGCGYRDERKELEWHRQCPRCRYTLWEQGIPLPVRWYDLRHSSATLHRMAGCDPLVIQMALGHAPETLTDSVYTHLSMDYMRQQLDKLKILEPVPEQAPLPLDK